MANSSRTLREERSFPVPTQARIQIMTDNKAQIMFPRGATLSPARTKFSDQADLLAYLKKFFPIVGSGKAGRMSMRCIGKYQRVDSSGRPILTFGDPVLDLITDPDGKVSVGGTVHDFGALLSSGQLAATGNNPGGPAGLRPVGSPPIVPPPVRPPPVGIPPVGIPPVGIPPVAPPAGVTDTVDYMNGSSRMRFHAWLDVFPLFWRMGSEIQTWGEDFFWAHIESQYGFRHKGTAALCAVAKRDSGEAAGTNYVSETEWGTDLVVGPYDGVRSLCSALWGGQVRVQLVQAGNACGTWEEGPPTLTFQPPPAPPVITWTPNVTIPDQQSKASPALAAFNDRLHMVHLGNSSNDIWHSTFDGTSWSPNVTIPDQQSKASPALAAFAGKLHMVHLGNSSNDIWHSTFDGTSWSPNVRIANQQSKASPALAAFAGKLHMVHLGDSSNDIWYSTFNGTSWSPNVRIPFQLSKSSPALAALSARLYMVHLGDTSNDIWQSTNDGASWSVNTRIPGQLSKASPALAEFRGNLHMVHLGDSSNDIWYSMSRG